MRMFFSALFFSDSYIKEQTDYKNKFGPDSTDFLYTFTNDIFRILWPMLITVTIKNILNVSLLMPKDVIVELNKYFTGEANKIKEAK